MRVFGYTWAGVRTSDPNSSSRFFSDILGLRRVHDGKGLVQFELPSGQLFEVFGSESRYNHPDEDNRKTFRVHNPVKSA